MSVPTVAPQIAVRLDDEEREAVAHIAASLRIPYLLHVTVSDALRAAIRESHSALRRERGEAHDV